MEERRDPVILAQYIYCIQDNEAKFVCFDEKCQSNAFFCENLVCKCQNLHKSCKKSQRSEVNLLFTTIQNKKRFINKQQQEIFQAIIKCFEQMVQKLSEKKAEFIQFIQKMGIAQQELQVVQLINNGQSSQIIGLTVHQILNKTIQPIYILDYQTIETIQQEINKWHLDLQNISQNMIKYTQQVTNIDSLIIKQKQVAQLLKFLPKYSQSFKLLYRGSQNQFMAEKFHKNCDNIPHTLVLIETQFGKIIGGYTPLSWKGSMNEWNNKYQTDYQRKSFIYSLSLNKKFDIFDYRQAIYHNSKQGPIFGGGFDLSLGDKCNVNALQTYAYFPTSYYSSQFCNDQEAFTAFSGQTDQFSFKVKQYQIYQIIWKENK